jgi:hypothetical protein
MYTDTNFLKTIAVEIAGRQNPDILSEPNADHRLLVEANRLEKAISETLRSIDNFTERDTFHNDVLGKLIDICDILYEQDHHITPDTQVLLDLLSAIRQILPKEISPLLRLPKAFVHARQEKLELQWEQYETMLRKYEIDKELVPIAAIPFQRFVSGKEKLYWGDYTWLKAYAAKLDAVDWEHADCNSTTEALMSLLIGRDFNHDQFFVYCKKYIMERVKAAGTKDRRLQEYELCRKLVQEDAQEGLPAFDRHGNPLAQRLLKLIAEETKALKTSSAAEYISKLSVVWNIETLSLFFKLLWDHKVFREVTLEVFSEQIAAAFSSKGKEEFKAHSIFGRFYIKDIEVLKALEELLSKMLEDVRRYLR